MPQNKRMQLTKLRAAPGRAYKVPPCAPAGETDGGTASQLIRSVRRTIGGRVARQEPRILRPYDFTPALAHPEDRRMALCVERVRHQHQDAGTWDIFGVPPVPDGGASDAELEGLERELGIPLPAEYRRFLARWRYLVIDDGYKVWGFDHQGVSIGRPWLSTEHRAGVRYLVVGDYWQFADGDQLMFDLSDAELPLVAYLHEHGPLYEAFAPSFSLALWRLVNSHE